VIWDVIDRWIDRGAVLLLVGSIVVLAASLGSGPPDDPGPSQSVDDGYGWPR
jgi:hypothetical protein